MKSFLICFFYILIFFSQSGLAQKTDYILQGKVHASDCKLVRIKSSELGDTALLAEPLSPSNGLSFETDSSVHWNQYRYLVAEIYQDNRYAVELTIRFHARIKGQDEGISLRAGINPMLPTQLIFPLSYLDGQNIFLPRFPRQLKGTVTGHRMDPAFVNGFELGIAPFDSGGFAPPVYLGKIRLTKELPPPLESTGIYYVDEFGQWNSPKWPGKALNVKDIQDELIVASTMAKSQSYPPGWSRFGGWTGKKFQATGFFRTEYDGDRWWFVDPEGNAFLSMGMDCVRNEVTTVYTGNEDLFEWVPGGTSETREALSNNKGMVMIDYLRSNLIRAWGHNWQKQWDTLTRDILRNLRFNTIGNWSDQRFAQQAQIPYVMPMKDFPSTHIKLYRDFPDVFDSAYRKEARLYAKQLEPLKNDPWLIGYFLDNEPHWAFGDNNLALEMLQSPGPSFTRKKLGQWLDTRYAHDTSRLDSAWKLPLQNFSVFDTIVLNNFSEQAKLDLQDFSGLMVDEYVTVVCEEVKKVDPHHLNLGLRYAWISSELCYRAGKNFDVFSINGYSNPGPPPTEEISRRSGKPVLIGEFHFGATDRGLPATGIQAAENQKARGEAYRYYVEQGFARPEVIGIHYFQWMDQPVTGRFDGENYNIGFMDICYKPYYELFDAARITHSRIYEIATHTLDPTEKIIRKIPAIYY